MEVDVNEPLIGTTGSAVAAVLTNSSPTQERAAAASVLEDTAMKEGPSRESPLDSEWCAAWLKYHLQLSSFCEEEHWLAQYSTTFFKWCTDEVQTRLFVWLDQASTSLVQSKTDAGEAMPPGNQLRFSNKIPLQITSGSIGEFAFLAKRTRMPLSKENFNEQVFVTCLRGDKIKYLLALVKGVYVPLSTREHGWPDSIKRDFTGQLQRFLATVTETVYQANGATLLYIPTNDVFELNAALKDNDLIQRLEAVVIHWTRQIKEVMMLQDTAEEIDTAGHLEEIMFWRERAVNLSRLMEQFNTPSFRKICEVLETSKSNYLQQFRLVQLAVQTAALEAEDNLKFLSALEVPGEKLSKARPEEIPPILLQLLNAVRMIWSTSTYYNTSERVSGLLRKISLEMIKRCQAAIDLPSMWNGTVTEAMKSLEESIQCGKAWKRLYQQMCKVIRRYGTQEKEWDFPEGTMFAEVDAFTQRCCDLLEVCECQQHFNTRCQKLPLPTFVGFRSKDIIENIYEIEDSFMKALHRLKSLDYFVLDVKATRWHSDFAVFKNQIKDLEFMYMSIITSAFERVHTVDAAAQVYDTFYMLAKRPRIRKFVEKKNTEIWNMFVQELALIKRHFEFVRKNLTPCLSIRFEHPSYAGLGLWARGLTLKIQNQMDILDTLYYMPSCREEEIARENFESTKAMLTAHLEQAFEGWSAELTQGDGANTNFNKRLERPLLIRIEATLLTRGRGGQLESNFDKSVLKNLQEAYFWHRMHNKGINLPYAAHEMLRCKDKLRILREHVLRVVRQYNVIFEADNLEERRLFLHHIRALDKKIAPGMQKLTWNSKGIKEFFVRDACKDCHVVYGYVKRFQANHSAILAHCKAISELRFLSIDRRRIYTDKEFRSTQLEQKKEKERYLVEVFANIEAVLCDSARLFEGHPPEIQREWKLYIDKIDKRLGDALKKAVRASLQDLSKALNATEGKGCTVDVVPLFKVYAYLDSKNKMDFRPTMSELKELLQTVCKDVCSTLHVVPRVWEHLQSIRGQDGSYKAQIEDTDTSDDRHVFVEGVKTGALQGNGEEQKKVATFYEMGSRDDDCVRLVIQIMKSLGNCASKLQERLKWWHNNYHPIVTTDKEEVIQKYAKVENPLPVVCTNIQRYTELQADIHQEEFKITICFVEADFTALKQALTKHCQQWQAQLIAHLHRSAVQGIHQLLRYFSKNTEAFKAVPTTTEAIQEKMNLWHKCKGEVPYLEDRIRPIEEQFAKLVELEVHVSAEEAAKLHSLRQLAEQYEADLNEAETMLSRTKKAMAAQMEVTIRSIGKQVADLFKKFVTAAPFDGSAFNFDPTLAFHTISLYKSEVAKLREAEENLLPQLKFFDIEQTEYKELGKMERDFDLLDSIWTLSEDWDREWSALKLQALHNIDGQSLERTAGAFEQRLLQLREVDMWPIWRRCQQELDQFRKGLPLISNLQSPAMRDRHWDRLKKEIAEPFDPKSPDFTLGTVVQLDFIRRADIIERLALEAHKEWKIEVDLQGISDAWSKLQIEITSYKDNLLRLKSNEELFNLLEEHLLALSVMKANQYHLPFRKEVDYWERTLAQVSDTVEMLLQVQKQWIYLENVFKGSDDIRLILPQEATTFDEVHAGFAAVLIEIAKDNNILRACGKAELLHVLNGMNEKLEKMQKSLDDYLEKKRQEFPRFYFLSNRDLLEILGHAREPDQLQKHMKQLFEGILSLDISPPGKRQNRTWEAEGMVSPDGERVKFQPKNVILEGPVEQWLAKVERTMRETLKRQLITVHQASLTKGGRKEKWIRDSCGQLVITSSQIAWTADTEGALRKIAKGNKNALKQLKKQQCKHLSKLVDLVKKPLSLTDQLKLASLIVVEVHARDVQERMILSKCDNENSFAWKSQLRFAMREELLDPQGGQALGSYMICQVLQTETVTPYGYEYQGNNKRLVVTPLTDKCYMTLTMALHLKLGGSLQGPAGAGKTETVKDLGKNIAKFVLVFNCSDALDYISLGRIFSGLAQSGAWGSFDEFDRIETEVLSVVAQQICVIQQALREIPNCEETTQTHKFLFEGHRVCLDPTCGIFITMNPGYASRTELPDNLTSLFRPVAMMAPDLSLICEITLLAEGFEDEVAHDVEIRRELRRMVAGLGKNVEAQFLAKKVVVLYQLMTQQLSKQDHYDFGLRAIRSVLSRAGNFRRSAPDAPEQEIMIRAILDLNLSKMITDDLPLFDVLLRDVFTEPDITSLQTHDSVLREAVEWALQSEGLQKVEGIILKSIQLFLAMQTRHGNMVVGETLTGKTTVWTTLQKAMTYLHSQGRHGYEKVKAYVINPKSVAVNELYGTFNIHTMEWTDGILAALMRNVCQDPKPSLKWIVLDGPVDTLWIESMNSVLDDNKTLTLINGDRIAVVPQVSLLFEVDNLYSASPATISRVGMVYMDRKNLGSEPLMESWLQKTFDNKDTRTFVGKLTEKYVEKILTARRECAHVVPTSDIHGILSFCRLFEALFARLRAELTGDNWLATTEKTFVFALIWSVGASVEAESRYVIDHCIRQSDHTFPPGRTVYDYFINFEKQEWKLWEDRLPSQYRPLDGTPFHKILVPTVDVLRNSFVVNSLVHKEAHVLCVGRTGTGKTPSILTAVLPELPEATHTALTMTFCIQTSSKNTQEIIERKLEKRVKNKYGPAGNRKLVCFVDDLNMPRRDTYGSQPPLELLRQVIDHGHWYDRTKQTLKHILDTQLLAAMSPPGGGRPFLPPRLQSRFNLLHFVELDQQQMKRIFSTMATYKFLDFREDVKGIAESVATATISVYEQVCSKFLPKPEKPHYVFSVRDISKVFQGIYQAEPRLFEDKDSVVKLWFHECLRVFHDRLASPEDCQEFLVLLNLALEKTFQVKIKDLCKGDKSLLFAALPTNGISSPDIFYDEIMDRELLRQYLMSRLAEYNEQTNTAKMNLVLFRDAVNHCCRIHRIIRLTHGHAALVGIGGSGRHSLTIFAAFLANQQCFQVEITRSYCHQDFQEDLKKLYHDTGVRCKKTTFLISDAEIVAETFMEDINNLLSLGEIPNLFNSDELGFLYKDLQKAASDAGVSTSNTDAMHDFFVARVRENLHVVFCIRPVGPQLRNYCRDYPALINNTTIDWFFPWPEDALKEVAGTFLSTCTLDENNREIVAEVFARVHTSVVRQSEELSRATKRKNCVTPTKFLELVEGYTRLYHEKTTEVRELVHKLSVGLSKLVQTRAQVEVMGTELEAKKEVVARKQNECQELLVAIIEKRTVADEQKKQVEADSERIANEEEETKILSEEARRDLAKAMPALEAAIDALDKLDKKSVAEVKAYTKPPDLVVKTMAAVMTVMEKTPSWSQAKVELNDPSFLTKVKSFDKDSISNSTLKKIEKYTKDSTFAPNSVLKVSKAAGALCMWVHAMQMYAEVYREVEPKRLRLKLAEEQLEKKQTDLLASKQRLRDIQNLLEGLKDQYNESIKTKDELNASAEELKLKMERAESLISGLAGERDRWEVSLATYTDELRCLPGDCLLAAAFMSYAGPFNADNRTRLVSSCWMPLLDHVVLPHNPNFDFAGFLANAVDVRQWNLQGLPTDRFSTENGVLVTKSIRWPLMIDPQNQGAKWIRNMEATNGLKILDPETKGYLKIILQAVETGKPVLVERVQDDLDPSLHSIISRSIFEARKTSSIKIGDTWVRLDPAFKLYLTTKIANPDFTPEVASSVNLVNFTVKEDGLTAQLLGIVVMKEEPRLEEQKNELVVKLAEGRRRLLDLEDEILRLLTNSQGSLLDDVELVATLQESKSTAEEVTRQIEVSEQTLQKIDQARDAYKPCGQRASVLYFVLHQLTVADPMYQFSLDSYLELFVNSIEKANDNNSMTASVEEHVQVLKDYHTLAVYRNACRALFDKHKLLLSLHLTTSILLSQGQIDREEYQFLLTGCTVTDRKSQPPNPDAGWIGQSVWDSICELDKLPNFQGFQTSYEQTLRDWRKWFAALEPEREPLPGEWQGRLDLLQKLLVIRCLRPDRFLAAATRFVSDAMDARFVETEPVDMAAVYAASRNTVPVIFILSKVDPTGQLMALAASKNIQAVAVALGQGQSARAEKLIRDGARHGFWVFLANCHLALSWLPTLEKVIEEVIDSRPHDNYRLWLSTQSHQAFPLALLQRSTKIALEPPRGLRSVLQRLLLQQSESEFNRVKVSDDKYKRLFFSLCWLHAILLERRRFQTLGWNVPYDFNDSDFIVSDNILAIYVEQYGNDMPWEALRYMIADTCYGGRVTDDRDMRLLRVYCADFVGPHTLQPNYKFSKCGLYYIPEEASLAAYRNYVKDVPTVDAPDAFGQHVNAEISSKIADAHRLISTLLLLQPLARPGDGSDGSEPTEERVLRLCQNIEQSWPSDVDLELISGRGEGDFSPLRTVLLQEIHRFNKLLCYVRKSLKNLVKSLVGLSIMSEEVEQEMVALSTGKVPEGWKFAYPSLLPLSSWVQDVKDRVDHLNKWGMEGSLNVYWLGGLTYPSGFLTALLQQFSRRSGISIDALNFDISVQATADETQISQPPREGAYVNKMYLEGAAWQSEHQCLRDPDPMKLYVEMPIVHFKPVARRRLPTEATYLCPLYLYPMRNGTRERPSFVTFVELKSGGVDPSFWVKRGTALLLARPE